MRSILALPFVLAASTAASAQCFDWTAGFGGPGFDFLPTAAIEFDGELYVSGSFEWADGLHADSLAHWDGTGWRPAGSGLRTSNGDDVFATASAIYDDGSGPALFIAGRFDEAGTASVLNVAKWDGAAWTALRGGLTSVGVGKLYDARAAAVYAGTLVIAGSFDTAGGAPAKNIAAWDGTSWSTLGDLGTSPSHVVNDLLVYDDGSGPALYACGDFDVGVGAAVSNVARWDGATWSAVGEVSNTTYDLAAFDDGTGLALYASATIAQQTVDYEITKWDGAAWNAFATTEGPLLDLLVHDDGGGTRLWCCGRFDVIGGVTAEGIAAWDGIGWSTLPGPTYQVGPPPTPATLGTLHSLVPYGPSGDLVALGFFTQVGPGSNLAEAHNIGLWDGSSWSALGLQPSGLNDEPYAFTFFDDGTGSELYAGGAFTRAGGRDADHIARWNGTRWLPLGAGVDWRVFALEAYDDGRGLALYAGGRFENAGGLPAERIARWDGTSWEPLGAGFDFNVMALAAHDDGNAPSLFAGGKFSLAGGAPASRVARWDGTSWSPVGLGIGGLVVNTLLVHDDGSGPELYAGGDFATAGGNPAANIARWDGLQWSPLGSGVNSGVLTLLSFDDGGGPVLCAGGWFNTAGGSFADHVARWDGAWSPLGAGFGQLVDALAIFDDGTGPAIVAAGNFPEHVARFDGSAWSTLGSGLPHSAGVLAERGPELFVGGKFQRAGPLYSSPGVPFTGRPSERMARFAAACTCDPVPYCTAGTTANGCTTALSAMGQAMVSNPAGFDVRATGVDGGRTGLFFFGLSGAKATPWGGGSSSWQCVQGPLQRTSLQSSGGTQGACDGQFALDFNAWMNANVTKAPSGGATVWIQSWFRDPHAPKSTSFSNALQFEVCP
jgi:hypothetical protein